MCTIISMLYQQIYTHINIFFQNIKITLNPKTLQDLLSLTIKTPDPQKPKNLRNLPVNPPINLLDLYQCEKLTSSNFPDNFLQLKKIGRIL